MSHQLVGAGLMAEFPALPLFTDAYLADTRHLTAEEHGAYLLLLMCAWRTRGCALKDCDRTLARIVGVTRLRWKKLRPVLSEFFEVSGGLWRQKKLSEVYDGVAARVAKNRANGAKGGRAKAARVRKADEAYGAGGGKAAGKLSGPSSGEPSGERLPAKTKGQNQTPEPKDAAESAKAEALEAVLAAAGLEEGRGDRAAFDGWCAGGADVDADILPAVRRIAARERAKAGRVPLSLAYYTPAIMEARDSRLGAVKAGHLHANAHPAPPPKRIFNPSSEADWREFLGDARSSFRGDYLSANWTIGREHPVFEAASLGPDPRDALNPRIPPAIMAEFGPRWRWRTS
jgi:uncharacterized protein YdaU (DUF1376 family)